MVPGNPGGCAFHQRCASSLFLVPKMVLMHDKVFISPYQGVFFVYMIIMTAQLCPDKQKIQCTHRDRGHEADRNNDECHRAQRHPKQRPNTANHKLEKILNAAWWSLATRNASSRRLWVKIYSSSRKPTVDALLLQMANSQFQSLHISVRTSHLLDCPIQLMLFLVNQLTKHCR